MKEEKIKGKMSVHICNYKRDGENCIEKGSKDLTDRLKKWAKEETDKEIRVFRSGCLGQCSDGIAIACYPQRTFLLNVKESDYKEIRNQLLEELEKIKLG